VSDKSWGDRNVRWMICYPGKAILGTPRLQRMRPSARTVSWPRRTRFFVRVACGWGGRASCCAWSLLYPLQLMGASPHLLPFDPSRRPWRWRPPYCPPMGSDPSGVGLGFFSFPFFALWSVGTPLTRDILGRECRLPPPHATWGLVL
jgi:hypothetical protein